MPALKVFLVKEFDVVVEADSMDEAEEAAIQSIDCGDVDYHWNPPGWEVANVVETDEVPIMGIGRQGTFVHISDAVSAEERDLFKCEHGVQVDMLGHGCMECEDQGVDLR
jgi:hypothetical protein